MLPVVCHCCQEYLVEEAWLDKLDGLGPRQWFRLKHGGYVLAEARTLDELAPAIDARGLLMWPEDDGCE